METNIPKRRGRPPVGTPVVLPPEMTVAPRVEAESTDIAKPTTRRRRASVGGHALKLTAPLREGFKRHWFNDTGNGLANAESLAYDHVSDTGLQSSNLGSRVSRLVGTQTNGEPMHAFLMETPLHEYEAGLKEKEVHNRQIDDAIVAGRDSTGQLAADGYKGSGSIQSGR
jgi:hypothetical protein